MRNRSKLFVGAAAAVAAALFPAVLRAATLTSQADAEIREDAPETMRGDPAIGGGVNELAVRVTSGQNRAAIIRFDLTGLAAADLMNFADLRLTFQRNGVTGGTNAGGIKIYGVNGDAPVTSTWNETTVHYRDAGDAVPVSPSGGHPGSQPSPGSPAAGDPVAPVAVNNAPTWNSNPNDPTRAPGLKHENPAYSQAAENTNTTRYNNNVAVRAAYLADLQDDGVVQGSYAYESYVNQPGYMTQSGGSWPDLASFDRPGATVGADIDPANTTFLGFLNYDARATARVGGDVLSFTTDSDNSPVNMGPSVYEANRTALVDYLTDLLDAGHTDATFLVFQKNAVDADPLPVRSDNLVFASKEFQPAGGNVGDWAPQLVVAPEPTGLGLFGFAALAMARRGRSRRGQQRPA
jgi:hypothetical protein